MYIYIYICVCSLIFHLSARLRQDFLIFDIIIYMCRGWLTIKLNNQYCLIAFSHAKLMASHVELRSCSLLRGWSIDISALKKTPGKANWQTPGSFAFKYNGVSHARWIVFYQCTGTRCESHSWYRKLFDWGKKKDENSAALPKEKASETIRKGSVWPPHGMSQFPKRVSFEQDYHALFVLAIYIACLSDTLFVSKFHYIKVKVFIWYISTLMYAGKIMSMLASTAIKHPWVHFFRKKNSKETSSDFHSLPSGKLT